MCETVNTIMRVKLFEMLYILLQNKKGRMVFSCCNHNDVAPVDAKPRAIPGLLTIREKATCYTDAMHVCVPGYAYHFILYFRTS